MGFLSRRSALAGSCILLFGVSIASRGESQERPSGGGGCGGGGFEVGDRDVTGPPDKGPGGGPPGDPAPTGQGWKPIETDNGCGRSGLAYVLVDEVCADGEGTDPKRLEAPMFRDGALVNGQLYAIDATHLWALDMSGSTVIGRRSLMTGIGQPLGVGASGSRLVVAAGTEGLVFVDAANPDEPQRTASLALPGPAFDVSLDGNTAYVAMGKGGVGELDISGAAPTLKRTIPVPGHHTAAVASDATNVYAAACTTFAIYDKATGALKGSVPFPKNGERLFTPAKDVALVGNVAFVAAGKQGAIAIDVSTPSAPKVLGRCGVNAESFYASGVRAEGDQVYVAGGEWGVLKINAKDPKTACISNLVPPPPETPPPTCSQAPPWQIVPWERVWAPPPPSKDPIQVLPAGDQLFAFGDARRIGVRAVDVRATSDLSLLRRYDEPRTLLGIAVRNSRIVVTGPKGGVFNADPNQLVVRSTAGGDEALVDASQVQILPDGRWVALKGDKVFIEGRALPITSSATAIAVRDGDVVVARKDALGAKIEDFGGAAFMSKGSVPYGQTAALPLSIAATAESVMYAAPEWVSAMKRPAKDGYLGAASTPKHEIFTDDDVMDISLWRKRVPRRHFAAKGTDMLELAVLGSQAGLAIHKASGVIQRAPLPALTYAAITSDATHAYAVAVDRSLYKSYLVTVALGGDAPQVVSLETFTGAASGVAAEAGKVYVSDADGVIRVYNRTGNVVAPLGAVRVEDRP